MRNVHFPVYRLVAITLLLVSLLSISSASAQTDSPPAWFDIAWSPDGSTLAAVGINIALFDENLEAIASANIDMLPDLTNAVAWSPDGSRLATTGFDLPVFLDRLGPTFYRLTVWDAHLQPITGATYDDLRLDSPIMWGADSDLYIPVMERPDNRLIYRWDAETLEWDDILWMPDIVGQSLGEGGRWMAPDGAPLTGYGFSLSPDSEQIVYAAYNEAAGTFSLRQVDTASGRIDRSISTPGYVTHSAWHEDGLLAAGGPRFLAIYDAGDGGLVQTLYTIDEGYRDITDMVWSPGGRYLAVVIYGEVEIWDVEKGEHVQKFFEDTTPELGVNALAWHPDGAKLAAALYSQANLRFFDVHELVTSTP